ncbi:MAG: LacI family DNA-binding transcriptional regulator [Armatimonadota bacterium]
MRKVAERAGVSMMTVSLALRNDASASRISKETCLHVRAIARELRYHPNARGRALRSGKNNVIGLYAGYGFVNVRLPFFTEIVSGLQEGCERFKNDLLLHGTFHGGTPDDIYAELVDGRVDGLVVQMPADDPLAERLANSPFPVVAVADALPGLPSITVDDAGGSRLLAMHLWERGYEEAVYISGSVLARSAIRRRDAFLSTAAEIGMRIIEPPPSDTVDWDEALRSRILPGPDGRRKVVVCWNDQAAYRMFANLRRSGLRVPEDVGVAGFDGCPTPLESIWSLCTVRAPWAVAARTAVEYLNALKEGSPIPEQTVLPVELVPGQTV